jgi:hypothetical protein
MDIRPSSGHYTAPQHIGRGPWSLLVKCEPSKDEPVLFKCAPRQVDEDWPAGQILSAYGLEYTMDLDQVMKTMSVRQLEIGRAMYELVDRAAGVSSKLDPKKQPESPSQYLAKLIQVERRGCTEVHEKRIAHLESLIDFFRDQDRQNHQSVLMQ